MRPRFHSLLPRLRAALLGPAVVLLCAACHTAANPAAALPATQAAAPLPERRLSYEDGRRFDGLFLEAIRQKEKENYDAEFELLTAALAVDPDAPEALYELALLKLSLGSTADTLSRAEGDSLLRRAVSLDPANTDYKETLANHLAARGSYDEAIALYEEMVSAEPDADRLTVLIGLQEEAGDYAGAISSLDRLEEMEGKDERYSIEKFKLYNEMGDNEHAYAAIEDLCAEYPGDLRYRVLLGDLYRQNGYNEMALAVYRDVLTLEPHNSYAQISLLAYYKTTGQDSLYRATLEDVVLNPDARSEAKVEAMRGFVTDAVRTQKDTADVLRLFDRALRLPQDNRDLPELCAYYMAAIGLPPERLEPVMEQILAIEPDYNRARLQLLDIVLRRDDMAAVVRVCHEGTLYNPTEVIYYYYEGAALLQLGDYAAALTALEAGTDHLADDTDTETASQLWAMLGDVRHELALNAEAYDAYEKALAYNPSNLLCLNNYAYFLALEGTRLDYAADMSRRTVDAEPQNATYLDTYAWVLYRLGQYTQARIYIDQTLRHLDTDEGNAGIYDHAGDIYYRCRLTAEAVKFWIKALGLSDDRAERDALNRKIRRRRL